MFGYRQLYVGQLGWLAALLLGCSASSGEGVPEAPATGTGGAASGAETSGIGGEVVMVPVTISPEAAASDDLTGLWTVIVTDVAGEAQTMRVNVNLGVLMFEHWTGLVSSIANNTAEAFEIYYFSSRREGDLVARHMSTVDMDFGAIPFELAGRWRLSNLLETGAACESNLGPTEVEAFCNEVFPPSWVGYLTDGRMQGTKLSDLPSMFGQLGGEWQISFNRGGSCIAHIEHTTVGVTCTGTAHLDGTSMLTFDGDTVSGFTSRGVEFSAYR